MQVLRYRIYFQGDRFTQSHIQLAVSIHVLSFKTTTIKGSPSTFNVSIKSIVVALYYIPRYVLK